MKRFLLLLLCLSTAVAHLMAETPVGAKKRTIPADANIVGFVVEKNSQTPIPGITIQIKGTNFGTATDANGQYYFRNVRPGKLMLMVRGVGYESQERDIEVVAGKRLNINFEVEEDAMSIDEVVVTANRQATLRRLAPTIVNVVGSEVFNRVNASNLSQGLVFQAGVRVENNCQNCGFNQVRINGLDGRYTQILIDSRPVFSALAGVYGIEQIPANMIDRVEVIRGGGSALYGSSAIGGVVNIITKQPTHNQFSFQESFTYTGFSAPDNVMSMNATVISEDNRAGAVIFGQSRYRHEWDANGDGFSELGRLNSRSLGTRAYLRTSEYSRLTGEFHTIQEFRRGGDHIDRPDHVAAISEHVDHSIYSGNLKYDLFSQNYKHHLQFFSSAQFINRKSYYGGIGINYIPNSGLVDYGVEGVEREKINNLIIEGQLGYPINPYNYGKNFGVTNGQTFNGGIQYTYDFEKLLFMPAQLLVGVDYLQDNLHDIMPILGWEVENLSNDGKPALEIDPKTGKKHFIPLFPPVDQSLRNWSQMAQLEWKNDMFSFLLGARLDENSLAGKPILSPRATFRYNPTKDVNFRLSYAKGFRAPQVFDEDLHVAVVNGNSQRVVNAEDLRPETSHSISASADLYANFDGVKANLLVEGFYNKLEDVFVTRIFKRRYNVETFKRFNGQGATIFGGNIEGKIATRFFQLQGGITLTSNMYDNEQEWGRVAEIESNGYPKVFKGIDLLGTSINAVNVRKFDKRILRTPNAYGYFTLGVGPFAGFNVALTGTYTGPMMVSHAILYGTYQTDKSWYRNNITPFMMEKYLESQGVTKLSGETEIHLDELVKTPSFFDLGAKVSYEFDFFTSNCVEVYAGVNNMLNSIQKDYDKGPDHDSGYIYGPVLPISAFAGLKYTF